MQQAPDRVSGAFDVCPGDDRRRLTVHGHAAPADEKGGEGEIPGVGIRPCIAPMPVPSSSAPVHSARAKCSSSPSRAALVPTSAGSRPEASSTPS